MRRECALRVDRCRNRVTRAGERVEERVALRVDLPAASDLERVADEAPLRGDDVAVPVAELVEQPRRALDVGEDEGHRPARQRHRPD